MCLAAANCDEGALTSAMAGFSCCHAPPEARASIIIICASHQPVWCAGGCFLLAGALYAWARQGYLTCYRGMMRLSLSRCHISCQQRHYAPCSHAAGIFLPLVREDWTSIDW